MVMIYMFASGLRQASNAMIGRYIGSGDVYLAKIYYKTFIQISIVTFIMLNYLVYKY